MFSRCSSRLSTPPSVAVSLLIGACARLQDQVLLFSAEDDHSGLCDSAVCASREKSSNRKTVSFTLRPAIETPRSEVVWPELHRLPGHHDATGTRDARDVSCNFALTLRSLRVLVGPLCVLCAECPVLFTYFYVELMRSPLY